MENADQNTTSTSRPLREAIVEYSKSNFYRVAHADGAVGGTTPQGFIRLAFFSERLIIPPHAEYDITEQGQGLERGARPSDPSTIHIDRELEVDIVLSPQTATALIELLRTLLEQLEAFRSQTQILREGAPESLP